MSGWHELKAERIGNRSPVSTRRCRPSFHRAFCRECSTARFAPPTPRPAFESVFGAPSHSALIASPGSLRLAAERRAAGLGASATVGGDDWHVPDAACAIPRTRIRTGARRLLAWGTRYRFGWHVDLWKTGPNKNAVWHCACVVAWQFWNAPSSQIRLLRLLQRRRCGQTGGRLWKPAEVDHRVPLFLVWSEHRDKPWPELLDFWACRTFR